MAKKGEKLTLEQLKEKCQTCIARGDCIIGYRATKEGEPEGFFFRHLCRIEVITDKALRPIAIGSLYRAVTESKLRGRRVSRSTDGIKIARPEDLTQNGTVRQLVVRRKKLGDRKRCRDFGQI